MSIKAKFSQDDIKKRYDRFLDQIEVQQIRILRYLGEECVEHARTIPADRGFKDRTGNLRSSIGYVIFKDGKPIDENFKAVIGPEATKTKGSKQIGIETGQKIASNAAQKHPKGLCLVVVAGMSYAVCVESLGRDVLTSAETLADKELPRMLDDLIDSINKAI